MHYLHPVFHSYSYQPGSRVDIDMDLPTKLEGEDLDLLMDIYSEPPHFIERIAPISAQLGDYVVRGKNWTEMMIKGYRIFINTFSTISSYIRQTLIDMFKENGMVPYFSLAISPDAMHRMLELDYESGESTYIKLADLYARGVVAPCLTAPFHVLLPTMSDYDTRLLIRIGLLFYWNLLTDYHKFLKKEHGDNNFVVNLWLPEGAYSERVIAIIYEEFIKKCKKERIKNPHLVFLLDFTQAEGCDTDTILKSWNTYRFNKSKADLASVMFKHRGFSDWVIRSGPSVKKLIDRTIAKSNADLNAAEINHCWAHFEDLESLTNTPKSLVSFEQKLIKLTELGYLSLSPDMFVRRKMNAHFTKADHEPVIVQIKDNTSWSDWHLTNVSLGRWEGTLDSNAEYKLVDENRPYFRMTEKGKVEEKGPQCWKIALNQAIANCARLVKGNPETYQDGILGILASLVPSKDKKTVRDNVDEFLIQYAHIYWREHFLNQGLSEADTYLPEIVAQALLGNGKKGLKNKEMIIAASLAQAYYFALDSQNTIATYWENFDQRAVYQNVVMIMLSMINTIYAYRWSGKKAEEKKLIDAIKTELIGFKTAYERYKLAEYGVTKAEWKDAIKSTVEDSDLNVVERAARRLAARYLRRLGYAKEFPATDEHITTNTGHIWSREVELTNFKWENNLFCGIKEE